MVLPTDGPWKGPADASETAHRVIVGLGSSDPAVMVAKVIKMAAAAEEASKPTMLQAGKVAENVVAPEIALEAPTGRIKKSNCRRACVTKYLSEGLTTPLQTKTSSSTFSNSALLKRLKSLGTL